MTRRAVIDRGFGASPLSISIPAPQQQPGCGGRSKAPTARTPQPTRSRRPAGSLPRTGPTSASGRRCAPPRRSSTGPQSAFPSRRPSAPRHPTPARPPRSGAGPRPTAPDTARYRPARGDAPARTTPTGRRGHARQAAYRISHDLVIRGRLDTGKRLQLAQRGHRQPQRRDANAIRRPFLQIGAQRERRRGQRMHALQGGPAPPGRQRAAVSAARVWARALRGRPRSASNVRNRRRGRGRARPAGPRPGRLRPRWPARHSSFSPLAAEIHKKARRDKCALKVIVTPIG